MGKVVAGMTMSLDGFVTDRKGDVGRLYPDFQTLPDTAIWADAIRNTGAVVMGRRSYDMAEDPDTFADTYEFQVPIFVLTTRPPQKPPKQNERLTFTFVSDGLESALAQASAAAGDKDVTVIGGASVVQQCLRKGLADELDIDIMPVLLGDGLRLFEHLGDQAIELEKIKVIETPIRTSLRFRVLKQE